MSTFNINYHRIFDGVYAQCTNVIFNRESIACILRLVYTAIKWVLVYKLIKKFMHFTHC